MSDRTVSVFPDPASRNDPATAGRGTPRVAVSGPAGSHGRRMTVYGFPGQGSQVKGMGRGLFDQFPEHTAIADRVLGYSIRHLCLEDPDGRLRLTRYAQPALYVVGALAYLKRRREVPEPPTYLIGHSLGEYVALFAAGAFGFADGLNLVRHRAELMSRARGGTMAAVLGPGSAEVESVLQAVGLTGVDVANYNAPRQTVLSGAVSDIDRARAVFEARGARVAALNVSAAFHSRVMRDVATEFASVLRTAKVRTPEIPVVANLNARPYQPGTVRETLVRQLFSPVHWVDTVHYLMDEGDFDFEELGPGKVLTGLVHRIRDTPDRSAPAGAARPAVVPSARPPVTAPAEPAPAGPQRVAPQASRTHQLRTHQLRAHHLGAASFRDRYGLRFASLAGAMYGGISSVELVARLARAGFLGFLGTAGIDAHRVERELRALRAQLGPAAPFGANLLYRHHDTAANQELVDVLLRSDIRVVEVSGFPRVTPELVRYRLKGGRIIAKVSRTDTAEAFLRPPPDDQVRELLRRGAISEAEAARGAGLPVASDLCVEAEGAWQPAGVGTATLLPAVLALRDALAGYGPRVHVGVAGGIGTPHSAAAAFLLGAEFVVTGSINQCTVEAATSAQVKELLQRLDIDDVAPAPWVEAFETGARRHVVSRGVLTAARADHLYRLWQEHGSYQELAPATWRRIEQVYRWQSPKAPGPAAGGPGRRHRLASALRCYLDAGFRLALAGDPGGQVDYLVYCGPAMGAFNRWVSGTPLEPWPARHVDVVAERLLADTAALIQQTPNQQRQQTPNQHSQPAPVQQTSSDPRVGPMWSGTVTREEER